MAQDQQLLLITLSNIGDLVMTTPVLELMHAKYPQAKIDIVADARSSDLLGPCPYRGEIYHREKNAGLREQLKLIRRLRRHHYELIVDLRTPILPYVLHGRIRLTKWRKKTHGPHAVEEHFATVAQLFNSTTIPAQRLWLEQQHLDQARASLRSLSGRLLAIAPGANWPLKIWPLKAYIELCHCLSDHFDGVVVLGSEAEISSAQAIVAESGLPCVNLAGRTSLLAASAAVSCCHAFVGNDSGLGHIAAALAVPSVTVFGPGEPQRYHPWGVTATHIIAPNNDLTKLTASAVAEHLLKHLHKTEPQTKASG